MKGWLDGWHVLTRGFLGIEPDVKPVCSSSQTCIFSTVGSLRYEGCGLPDTNYDWITGM